MVSLTKMIATHRRNFWALLLETQCVESHRFDVVGAECPGPKDGNRAILFRRLCRENYFEISMQLSTTTQQNLLFSTIDEKKFIGAEITLLDTFVGPE